MSAGLSLPIVLLCLTQNGAAVPPSVDPGASCAACHQDVAAARQVEGNVHEDLACDDCHQGWAFNPHVAPERDQDLYDEAAGLEVYAQRDPVAYLACEACHDEVVASWRESVHGTEHPDADAPGRPGCADCHGDVHAITSDSNDKLLMAERCIACHSFGAEGHPPRSPHVVDSYRDTIHGKMLRLGNEQAAACADCHTGHDVRPASDPLSTVSAERKQETCGQCHPGATARFAGAISHTPPTIDEDFWSWLTLLFFSVLTLGTIALLALHVLADLLRTGRKALANRGQQHFDPGGPVKADQEFERFSIHARLQHWGMMLSFTLLVITGWPLKAAAVGTSNQLAELLGGQQALALVHRISGALLILVSVYHIVWLGVLASRRQLRFEMLPSLQDVKDLFGNLQYYLGLRPERPRFARFAYHEKFDYWAVFWGMFIMGGSGLILWFPVLASKLLPGKLIAISHIAHSDEALLAALAIFVWHFYNVHLRPTVFPMSWVWLTGRISAEAMWDEHRGEYVDRFGEQAPAPPEEHAGWPARHRWSYLALALVLLISIAVVVGNVASVRDRVRELSGGHAAAVADHQPAPAEPALVSVFDPGFDVYQRCFECHNRERFERGAVFPHQEHFDDERTEGECRSCHQTRWHEEMIVQTEGCLDCHEPEEIGAYPQDGK